MFAYLCVLVFVCLLGCLLVLFVFFFVCLFVFLSHLAHFVLILHKSRSFIYFYFFYYAKINILTPVHWFEAAGFAYFFNIPVI